MPLTGSLRNLLLRGLLAGLIAGLLAATVGYFTGEPAIDAAIAIEEAAGDPGPHDAEGHEGSTAGHSHGESAAGHSHGDEEALVSRNGQRFGLFLALGLSGMAFGALFALAADRARRHTRLPATQLALSVAVLGWLAIVVVPFFKYPANPPAVGDPDTIGGRTWLWVAVVLLGLVAVGAGLFAAKLLDRAPDAFRWAAGAGAFVLVTTLGYVLLPGVNEVAADFPAALLWEFRVAALAQTTTLWAALGIGFAVLSAVAQRDTQPAAEPRPVA